MFGITFSVVYLKSDPHVAMFGLEEVQFNDFRNGGFCDSIVLLIGNNCSLVFYQDLEIRLGIDACRLYTYLKLKVLC